MKLSLAVLLVSTTLVFSAGLVFATTDSELKQRRETREEKGIGSHYIFRDEHFTSLFRTPHGRFDVLPKFTDRSEVFRGIESYRVAILEANPQAFIAPSILDADAVLFIAKGRGIITMIGEERRESLNIEHGDVISVPAGTPLYLVNSDEIEKLSIVQLVRSVNAPGKFEAHTPGGGEDPETLYNAFSSEFLEAAFKTERRSLDQVFRQKKGAIVKASKNQIEGMSGEIWNFGGKSYRKFNLLHKRPVHSNIYGQLFEAKPEDHKQQLQDLDVVVTIANITKGSMMGPFYNSRSTQISVVLGGGGFFELILCDRPEGVLDYQTASSELSPGMVFVTPAAHPVVVASTDNSLLLLSFIVNAKGNIRHTVAGKNNIVSKMGREAKELAFDSEAREVDQVFGNQNEELFMAGPSLPKRKNSAFA